MHASCRWLAATVVSLSLSTFVWAQTFPAKPVTLMVPYPAGGVSDVIARTLNTTLAKHLGQPVIVENLGGASGGIAAQKVLNSPADGYMIFQGSPNELILAPMANAAIKYKPEDFRLVQMITINPLVMFARKDFPADNPAQFLAVAKQAAADKKPLTYASVGPGSMYHLLGEHMSKMTGIPMTHVPYKGGAPANQDLIGGQVDIFITVYGKSYQQLADSGKIKILAMLNNERVEGVKQYPAISESKQLKNFTHNIWTGFFVKKDTPEPIVQALHKAVTETLGDPAVRAGLDTNSQQVPRALSLQEASKAYAEGTAQFRAIAKSINLQPQ